MSGKLKDYTYDFTDENVKKAIIDEFQELTEGKTPASEPRVVFTGGLPGAGKVL